MTLSAGKTTFRALFDSVRGEIPEIQRDYAHGRTDESSTEIRESFLEDLRDVLDPEGSGRLMDLDFIYGRLADDVLYPLDGQQRLTTLFLLHWYLANRDDRFDEFESWAVGPDNHARFTYRVRSSATSFFDKLVRQRVATKELPAPINSAYSSRVSRPEWSDRAVAESALRRRGRRSGGGGRQGVDIQRSKPRWPALHPSYHSPLPLYLPSPRSGGKANMAPSPNWLSRTLSPAAPSTPCASVEGWRWKESLPYPTASLGMASR